MVKCAEDQTKNKVEDKVNRKVGKGQSSLIADNTTDEGCAKTVITFTVTDVSDHFLSSILTIDNLNY